MYHRLTSLIALSRVLDLARTSATRPSTAPTATQHRAAVHELDATRLSLAKAINDAESSLASREAELASLKEEVRVLEECDPAVEHERELNGTTSVFIHLPLLGTDLVRWSGCDYKYTRGWASNPSQTKMADLLRCSSVSRPKLFHKGRSLSNHCSYIRCGVGWHPLCLVRWQSQIQCRIYRFAVEIGIFLTSHFYFMSIAFIFSFIYSFNATLDHTTASHDIPHLDMYHGHDCVVSRKRVDKVQTWCPFSSG